jgi:hypothetical protein
MTRKYLIDLAERVFASFVEGFATLILMDQTGAVSLDLAEQAFWAGVIAALAVLKGAAARFRGDKENPSLVAPPIRTTLDGGR